MLGLGILVKASGLLGLVGLVAWSIVHDRRGAARIAVAAGVTTLIGYAAAGTPALRAVMHAGNGNSRASVWDPISSALHPSTAAMLIVVVLLTAFAAYRWRNARRPDTTALATMAASLVAGVYVLPWYPAWALPTAALSPRSRLSVLVAAHAAFLSAVYEYERPAHTTLWGAWGVVRTGVVQTVGWVLLALFVALIMRSPTPEPAS